jgi:hypothetical protein
MSVMMGAITPPLSATGAVLVSSFVKMDPATKYCCLQATGPQDIPIGVSQQGSFQAPGLQGGNTTLCTPTPTPTSTTPFQITVFGIGSIVRLQLDPLCNAVIPGQLLCSSQAGLGMDLANATIGNLQLLYAGAMALTNGAGGQTIRVLVIAPFALSPNVTETLRVSLTPTTIGAFTAADQTFSIAGFNAAPNDPVVVSGESLPAGVGIVNAIALSAGSLKIRFANVTATSIVPSAQFFDIMTLP